MYIALLSFEFIFNMYYGNKNDLRNSPVNGQTDGDNPVVIQTPYNTNTLTSNIQPKNLQIVGLNGGFYVINLCIVS